MGSRAGLGLLADHLAPAASQSPRGLRVIGDQFVDHPQPGGLLI